MNYIGQPTTTYAVRFKRKTSSTMAVGFFSEVDLHREEVNASSKEEAVAKVAKFQKEQLNREIEIFSVAPLYPED